MCVCLNVHSNSAVNSRSHMCALFSSRFVCISIRHTTMRYGIKMRHWHKHSDFTSHYVHIIFIYIIKYYIERHKCRFHNVQRLTHSEREHRSEMRACEQEGNRVRWKKRKKMGEEARERERESSKRQTRWYNVQIMKFALELSLIATHTFHTSQLSRHLNHPQ